MSHRLWPLCVWVTVQCVFLPSMLSDASSPLPSQQASKNLHTNEHLNGLYDIIDLQLEIFLSWSLCTGWTKYAKWGTAHTHTHTHTQRGRKMAAILHINESH